MKVELSSHLERTAVVGSIKVFDHGLSGNTLLLSTGADAGSDCVIVVAIGRTNGFRAHEPDGKRRILRGRVTILVSSLVPTGGGRPQEAPKDELDMMDVGRDDTDGPEWEDVAFPDLVSEDAARLALSSSF